MKRYLADRLSGAMVVALIDGVPDFRVIGPDKWCRLSFNSTSAVVAAYFGRPIL
jgi:hypothetical protein